ncbi:hypothetical protein, partial [Pseudoalteromonas sp. MelDa3]|uniref:hypothetical protein n=1 Tax=Pseudoalteromonas sp. MelDa3 TaxID=888435 RepID=UPI000CC7A779
SGRFEIWAFNFNLASESPLLGLGSTSELRSSHNVFLDVFVWSGLLGLLVYLFFTLSILRRSLTSAFCYKSNFELAIFMSILFILLKSGGGFEIKFIWLFLAFIAVPSKMKKRE